jgi:protein-disulfide isomerase
MASGKASKRRRAAERAQVPAPRVRGQGSPDRRLWVALAVAAALLLAVILGIVLTRGDGDDASDGSTLAGADEVMALFASIPQEGVELGERAAPVTLVEFVDMQCPFCREFETDAVPTLVEERVAEGTLRMETRGLAFIGPDSERGLRAVLAAGLQGKAYEMKALLFANQGAENSGWLSEDLVEAAARSIPGLDVTRLLEDMESDEVTGLIGEHAQEAESRGVNSTPTVFVGPTGGELELVQMETPTDLAAIEAAIEAAAG